MFRKLVSNLAFSPGVSTQLAFYARRLRGEDLTRRLSAVFGVGIMAFQLLAVIAPASSVNASGANDIIQGGFTEKGQLIQILKNNPETKKLFDQLGITTERLYVASAPKYIPARNSTKRSIGRQRQNTSDQAYTAGSTTYFTRPLSSVATTANGRAIEGTTTSGAYFAVLLSCGNPVMDSFPNPTPPPTTPQKPELHITKTTLPGFPVNGAKVTRNTVLGYRVFFSNLGAGPGYGVTLTDPIPAGSHYFIHGSGGASRHDYESSSKPPYLGQPASRHVWWEYDNMPAGAENYYIDLKVSVPWNASDGTRICNIATIRAINAPPKPSNEICHTVQVDAPPPEETPETPIPPIVIPETPAPAPTPTPVPTPTPTPTPTPPPVPTPTSPNIHMSKTAVYLTRSDSAGKPVDANATTAKAGETIEYTLKTLNSGTGAKTGFILSEPLADVLEYADLVNAGGGTLTSNHLVWPATDIAAGSTITRVFQVKVKSPIPATPRSGSDIFSYDLRMDNVYGDQVKIAVETPTPARQVEAATQTLPQTGAETSILIVFFVAAMGVYFYSRNRQLIHEVAILRVDHNPGV